MRIDILIIGDIAGFDALFAEHIKRRFKSLKVLVLRKNWGKKQEVKDFDEYFKEFNLDTIVYINNSIEFINYAKKSRIIVSVGGAFLGFSRWFYFFKSILNLPPLINITVGSDFLETTQRKDWMGIMYRNFLNYAKINILASYPSHLEVAIRYKVKNVSFIRIPLIVPNYINNKNINLQKDELIFFLPSHLDFGITDNHKNRKIHKGNDRFIRAFIKALDSGLKAKCIILDRGADKDIAKELITKNGKEKYFIWKPHLNRNELLRTINLSDVVVDQFLAGVPGMIAIEAMSQKKPLITYINILSSKVMYDTPPPVLNCQNEEEIYKQIMKCQDREYLKKLGENARDWVVKNHKWDYCLDEFLFHYQRLTGHQIIDYVNQKELDIK